MLDTRKNEFIGSYGVFLETVNQPTPPLKHQILSTLEQHDGYMEMKALIVSLDACATNIMNTISILKKQNFIQITNSRNKEIVSII